MHFKKVDFQLLDQKASAGINGWQFYTNAKYTKHGLDFSELIRFYLWDKVARSLRYTHFPEFISFEDSVYNVNANLDSYEYWEVNAYSKASPDIFVLKKRIKHSLNVSSKTSAGDIDVLIPFPSPRIASVIQAVIDAKRFRTGLPSPCLSCFPGALSVNNSLEISTQEGRFSETLASSVQAGLAHFDITLLESDVELFKLQIAYLVRIVQALYSILQRTNPKVILVHADNHPPYQVAVLVARKLGIPSIMIQHGLDCERFYLDKAYASHIAVWGVERFNRYHRGNGQTHSTMHITGNPDFDRRTLVPISISGKGKWLWVTRPHSSQKCYSPSRLPIEGLEIMEAICAALKLASDDPILIIKPHPFDYQAQYLEIAKREGVIDRVVIENGPIAKALASSDIVISEDSTAGLEALIEGKLLVHAHFALTDPTIPFVEYDAALPGFNKQQLVDNLLRSSKLSLDEVHKLMAGRKAFVQDFCGPLDNSATDRVVALVSDVLNGVGL